MLIAPAARAITPVLRDQIRPFLREARPLVRDLRPTPRAAVGGDPEPDPVAQAAQPRGQHARLQPERPRATGRKGREEGYLFWAGWVGHQGVNLFSNSDAHGIFRPGRLPATCTRSSRIIEDEPEAEFLLNLTPIITSSAACQGKGFGPCPSSPDLAGSYGSGGSDVCRRSPPSVARIAIMIAFAISCFGLLLFLWLSFGGPVPLQPKGYRFEVAFPEATQLGQEADVRIAGVSVGKVRHVERDPRGNATLTDIEIDSRYAPIPRDVRAVLRQKTLLGETFVELTPGTPSGRSCPTAAGCRTLRCSAP